MAARLMGARVLQTIHAHTKVPLHRACLWLACWLSHERIVVSEAIAREMAISAQVIPAYINPGPEDEVIPEDVAAWLLKQRETGRKIIAMNAFQPDKINDIDLYGLDMLIDVFVKPGIRKKFSAIACISDVRSRSRLFRRTEAKTESTKPRRSILAANRTDRLFRRFETQRSFCTTDNYRW